jgi:hypothetical protein
MKSKLLSMSAAALSVTALSFCAPAFADGIVGTGASLVGSTTALLIDVPQGAVVSSTVKVPYSATKGLAAAFGDENGWKQNIVGAVIGVPTGFVFGIPYGAIKGAKHALSVGWDKPFSAESFIVSNEGK